MATIVKADEFLVDKHGSPKGVVLKLTVYRKLLKLLEDLEDALDLKHAVETSRGKITHRELTSQLKKAGLL